MNRHTIPNHLPLFTIDERDDPILMVKCVNFDQFSKVKIDWCFQKVLISYDLSKNILASEVTYMTVELKKLVLSVVNTVVAFVVLSFRPILDFRYMCFEPRYTRLQNSSSSCLFVRHHQQLRLSALPPRPTVVSWPSCESFVHSFESFVLLSFSFLIFSFESVYIYRIHSRLN